MLGKDMIRAAVEPDFDIEFVEIDEKGNDVSYFGVDEVQIVNESHTVQLIGHRLADDE